MNLREREDGETHRKFLIEGNTTKANYFEHFDRIFGSFFISKSSYTSSSVSFPYPSIPLHKSLLDFLTCLTLRNVLRLDLSASRVSDIVCQRVRNAQATETLSP
ncbi:hypothetical protein CEXT_549251 [Caerostris extrusa]|uniref:Uncharacterized protein n=1 Tax=Caerostris extrusa TaxID=172846 RepID=A0AAV4V398_CAEEX|nr:hypothetical protein CEXT_549251 [Caerostris extrusa]